MFFSNRKLCDSKVAVERLALLHVFLNLRKQVDSSDGGNLESQHNQISRVSGPSVSLSRLSVACVRWCRILGPCFLFLSSWPVCRIPSSKRTMGGGFPSRTHISQSWVRHLGNSTYDLHQPTVFHPAPPESTFHLLRHFTSQPYSPTRATVAAGLRRSIVFWDKTIAYSLLSPTAGVSREYRTPRKKKSLKC